MEVAEESSYNPEFFKTIHQEIFEILKKSNQLLETQVTLPKMPLSELKETLLTNLEQVKEKINEKEKALQEGYYDLERLFN